MLSSLRCLTLLWGAHAFLLCCCGVPGAELKPRGCSLQPAPTARHGVYINVSLELFSLGQENQVSASRANPPGGVCLEKDCDLPALGISSLCLSQIADLPTPAGLPCNSLLSLAGTVPPGRLQGQMSMVGYEEEKLYLSPSVLAGILWDAHRAGLGSCSVGRAVFALGGKKSVCIFVLMWPESQNLSCS